MFCDSKLVVSILGNIEGPTESAIGITTVCTYVALIRYVRTLRSTYVLYEVFKYGTDTTFGISVRCIVL